jgi:hypothetical protein
MVEIVSKLKCDPRRNALTRYSIEAIFFGRKVDVGVISGWHGM